MQNSLSYDHSVAYLKRQKRSNLTKILKNAINSTLYSHPSPKSRFHNNPIKMVYDLGDEKRLLIMPLVIFESDIRNESGYRSLLHSGPRSTCPLYRTKLDRLSTSLNYHHGAYSSIYLQSVQVSYNSNGLVIILICII